MSGHASKTLAGDWLANSDASIKTDIHDIEDALETISRLRPVRFRYTDAYRAQHPCIEDRPYYNFIAQEFREVFPGSVQDDGTGLLQLDAYNVRPYLVRAVQELSAAVQELSAENEALKARLHKLEVKDEDSPIKE